MPESIVVWLRRDLRLADNPALQEALNQAVAEKLNLILLYIHAPATETPWSHGAASQVWLHHSLLQVIKDIDAIGGRLLIKQADSVASICEIFQSLQAKQVHWNRLYDPNTIDRDKQIKQTLSEAGIVCHSHKAALLFEPWQLQTGKGDPYRVFTPMWKAMLKQGITVKPLAAPRVLPTVANTLRSLSVNDLALLPSRSEKVNSEQWHTSMMQHWQVGEHAAQQRLQTQLDTLLKHYKSGRDFPAADFTSKLSPYLHFGQISPAQVTATMQQAMAMADPKQATVVEEQAMAFIREIAWREFAHHVLYHYPHLTEQPMQPKFKDFTWENNPEFLRRWQQGQTGIPIVDAGMRQLYQSGWMHNRVRMIVGSLLTKNLRLHWLDGAQWFWDTLVDADLANNTLGWQWIAGCGADAAPYFRIFNPVTQSEKFDAQGEYIKTYVPELAKLPAKYTHAPWEAPADILTAANITLGKDYPKPIVDLKISRQVALDAYKAIKS